MAFKDVAGNEGVKRILRLALERGRVPNSLIFCGPEGVGKSALALTLAKALNCRAQAADACDDCPSCRAIDAGTHPDVMTLTVEVQKVKAEQAALVKQMACLRPMTGRKRVFIIDDAKDMSAEAANSLLKVLEEPPSFLHLILVTDSPHLLLPTIRSRCGVLAFSPIGREVIERALAGRDFTPEQARILALLVDGNFDRARELVWEEVQALRESAWTLFDAVSADDRPSRFLERFGAVPKSAQEELGRVLEIFASFARDLLLLRLGGQPALLLNPDLEDRLRQAAPAWTAARLLDLLADLDTLLVQLEGNMNKSLLATTFFSDFMELRHA
ncbi:MAG TPA: DNA polymerase III subunit delta' [Candidatus Aminicenantes bacterium]|nr:DNA polymerase III subunit delta' [Candidatus Aminicenantes bacterium]HRY66196.1 DNA polymerase III subunit delta' [Candidatus Aminicenantes bacterium]HRZ73110.1 DNA polymerase III subunit delta' [Candidatus Aminicenantes bacterium]